MKGLLAHLRKHFDPLEDRYLCFAEVGVQLEGWLKGEMFVALDNLCDGRIIKDYDREVRFERGSRRKVDLAIDTERIRHWVELKYWLVGEQKGDRYGPLFYFPDRSSVGIIEDVNKLRSITLPGDLWLLILNVVNPGQAEWEEGLQRFITKFGLSIESLSEPTDYPASYFLGLIHVPRDQMGGS